MAIVITSQPTDTTVVAGVITESLTLTATGATGYQWKQSKDGTSVSGATVVAGQTTNKMTIPTGLAVGTYYYFCAVSDDSSTVNSNIVTVTDYISKCSAEAKARFAELQVLRGITIPDNDNALRTEQIELFMEAI